MRNEAKSEKVGGKRKLAMIIEHPKSELRGVPVQSFDCHRPLRLTRGRSEKTATLFVFVYIVPILYNTQGLQTLYMQANYAIGNKR